MDWNRIISSKVRAGRLLALALALLYFFQPVSAQEQEEKKGRESAYEVLSSRISYETEGGLKYPESRYELFFGVQMFLSNEVAFADPGLPTGPVDIKAIPDERDFFSIAFGMNFHPFFGRASFSGALEFGASTFTEQIAVGATGNVPAYHIDRKNRYESFALPLFVNYALNARNKWVTPLLKIGIQPAVVKESIGEEESFRFESPEDIGAVFPDEISNAVDPLAVAFSRQPSFPKSRLYYYNTSALAGGELQLGADELISLHLSVNTYIPLPFLSGRLSNIEGSPEALWADHFYISHPKVQFLQVNTGVKIVLNFGMLTKTRSKRIIGVQQ